MASVTYYSVLWVDDPKLVGLARPVDEGSEFNDYISSRKRHPGTIERWVEQEYRLHGSGRFTDYPAEVRALRLCSGRLRLCLDKVKGERDEVQWLPASVTNEDGERRRYWVLHFPEEPEDLLDIDLSTYGPLDEVVKGYLGRKKAAGRHVMPSPDGDFVSFVVSERARDAIVASGCEVIEFDRFRTN